MRGDYMYQVYEEPNWLEVIDNNFITIEKFENMFGTADNHKFNYDYLYNHENSTSGWKNAFNKWKQKGILD